MPNIKPISDLRNYSEVLRDVDVGAPVFLTKNGRGRYVIVDMQDYRENTGNDPPDERACKRPSLWRNGRLADNGRYEGALPRKSE